MNNGYVHENIWPWGKSVLIIAEYGAGVVELSFEKTQPGVAYLSNLSVVPLRRRSGIATRLLLDAQQYCLKSGVFRIDLNSVQIDWVMGFYHKFGFKDIEENEGFMRMYKLL